ncbi:50S ribosomal protein L24 [bacterium]|nr:50S ribosomal protein L24 [bacterium]NBW99245.1 50S ribosomal protein L24 [bacterium]NBX83013.1 50S ribosomal protein L24 [bacterium]
MRFKIKKGDLVQVRVGKDRGKTGKVIKVSRKHGRLVVEGINMQKRHEKAKPGAPGGIQTKEGAIQYSNVMLVDKAGKPTRIGHQWVEKDGKKVKTRIARTTGEQI